MASTMATNRSAVHNNVCNQGLAVSLPFTSTRILISHRFGLILSAHQLSTATDQVLRTTHRWAMVFPQAKTAGTTIYGQEIHSAPMGSPRVPSLEVSNTIYTTHLPPFPLPSKSLELTIIPICRERFPREVRLQFPIGNIRIRWLGRPT